MFPQDGNNDLHMFPQDSNNELHVFSQDANNELEMFPQDGNNELYIYIYIFVSSINYKLIYLKLTPALRNELKCSTLTFPMLVLSGMHQYYFSLFPG